MRVSVNEDLGIVMMTPTQISEKVFFEGLRILGEKGTTLLYKGHRMRNKNSPDERILLTVQDPSNILLVIEGDQKADDDGLRHLKDLLYYGSSKLEILDFIGDEMILFTVDRCKTCNRPMADFSSCEWKICKFCAQLCPHNYTRDAIHGGSVDIGIGEFCNICGRGKPKDPHQLALTRQEHHEALLRELGVIVISVSN